MSVDLYQHKTRQQWGLAVEAWSRGSTRGYQFEDGALRTFHRDFCHLMVPVKLPPEEARSRRATLVRLLGGDPETTTRGRRTVESAAFTFDDQVALFRELFPEGFQGEAWVAATRSGKRALKRHREPASELARELLAQDALDLLIEAEDFEVVLERAGTVLAATDLVSASHRRKLQDKDEADARRFAQALRDLLYGDPLDFSGRFRRYVDELGSSPAWNLATAHLALVHPGEHTCVRPSSFKVQAKVLRPQLAYCKHPTPHLYEGYRALATSVQQKLTDAGLEPRDLLDVYDFMWATLKPKSLETLRSAEDGSTGAEAAEAA